MAAGYRSDPARDPGGVLDLARAYRRGNQNAAALALWRAQGAAAQKAAPDHLPAFWSERQQLARQLLHDSDPRGALDVTAGHGQTDPSLAVEAEFLAGFIALRRLNDPATAERHFAALAAASPAILTQSRAWYWLGRAKQASGGDGHAEFTRAAGWPMTFYGQLAARAGGLSDAALIQALRVPLTPERGLPTAPVMTELARAGRFVLAWGDDRRARQVLLRMEELAHTPEERLAVGEYGTAIGMPDIAVWVARRLGRDGVIPDMHGWPVPYEPPAPPEQAFSLAITRQESNFDMAIMSPVGARGLMQLMPATAASVARGLGQPAAIDRLTTDPAYNLRLGTSYLSEMLGKFDNAEPMAAAAYNAGPGRVVRWLSEMGDPRIGAVSMVDWIEFIPLNETRNYVQRVLENTVVYQARRTGTLPSGLARWSR